MKANEQSKKIAYQIGFICGTGLEKLTSFEKHGESFVKTPFSDEPVKLNLGSVNKVPCIFMPRHGSDHSVPPSKINYRANLWALLNSGVKLVIATAACGSLKEEIAPGSILFPDSFIDMTKTRERTFHDGTTLNGVSHIPSHPAFSEPLRKVLIESAQELNLKHFPTGTCVCIEGPRYSSKAESSIFRQWNADVINMTMCPEVYLAKEIGLLYSTVVMVTDYDCWKEGDETSVSVVTDMVGKIVLKVEKLLAVAIKKLDAINKIDANNKIDWPAEIKNAKMIALDSLMLADKKNVTYLKY